MIIKYLFFLLNVYSIIAAINFIEKYRRAEIFELTDNELPIFKVYLPEKELESLKEAINLVYGVFTKQLNPEECIENKLKSCTDNIDYYLEMLLNKNYTDIFPEYNFNKILPELKIDLTGYPTINKEEILKGFNIKLENYVNIDINNIEIELDKYLFEMINNNNLNFNLLKIISVLSTLKWNENIDINDYKYYSFHSFLLNGNDIVENDGIYIYKRKNVIDEKSRMNQCSVSYGSLVKYKTKNATLTTELNGVCNSYKKVTFSVGGKNSRQYYKPGYNIKIRGGKNFHGRNQFKLRADVTEPTRLRSKLALDIYNRSGLLSISANYAILYINDEYMGLYILTDIYKKSWVESVYGEKNTSTLYKCENGSFLSLETVKGCVNENEDVKDNTELIELVKTLDNAKSELDIKNIFDVDYFLHSMAIEYLLGSWDHILNGHNYYMYKPKNGKWLYLTHDFDYDIGYTDTNDYNYKDYSISKFFVEDNPLPFIKILILDNPVRFQYILKEIVENVFNPSILFPHIDELKAFIKPYIELDKTPNENGILPGQWNMNNKDRGIYTLEQWDASSEFTVVQNHVYGLKYWILERYRNVCKNLNIECDPVYMDKNYKYSINKNIEVNFVIIYKGMDTTNINSNINMSNNNNNNNNNSLNNQSTTTTTTTTTTITTTTTTPYTSLSIPSQYKCLSELIGYACCSLELTSIYTDEYGDWGYDYNKKEWCGLTPYDDKYLKFLDNCWSKKLGYSCCEGCKVIETDEDGSWGYEYDQWCGIPLNCQ
ncbi:coth-domain-containing protein [Anaeromyces robustus]|uniref:Coth-domain-containing protein n=1 Tax=Anaeromyces robustus TaxID=1754192 RepID=A0A1Y1X829_9FUNG|nr:coth-domain-containing protein [Anaeromyces robustus]|eukprot:ORX81868.1 coth-domain-containing protein [Anaeromyces robustus]